MLKPGGFGLEGCGGVRVVALKVVVAREVQEETVVVWLHVFHKFSQLLRTLFGALGGSGVVRP